ncbi:MAG: alkaline phosphatase PhoX, partial [Pseudomonadota bacterium]
STSVRRHAEIIAIVELVLALAFKKQLDLVRSRAAPNGHLIVCEDQYTDVVDNHLRGITSDGEPYAFARLRMQTELAGGCFSPDGQWFFVNAYAPTRTFAIKGPWTA